MTNRPIAAILLLTLSLCGSLPSAAQLAVPALSGRVVDETGTLSAGQKAALERTLQEFEARKGSQIAVLIVATTAPEAIEPYALRVAEQWKLGRRKIDDGAVLIVAKSDQAMRIEVGYGLEGVLNDATAKRIISEAITPRFQQGDFNGGLVAGIDQMIRVIDGEALPALARKPGTGLVDFQQYSPVIFVLAVVIGGVMRAVLGSFPGALATGGVVAVVAWLFAGALSIAMVAGVIALLVTLLGGGMGGIAMGGRHGGFRSGGGGFGGGGGGFGGGGASGRW